MAGKYVLGAVGGISSYVLGNHFLGQGKPLHIEVKHQPKLEVMGLNILPGVAAVLRSLPESWRSSIMVKGNAPKADAIPDWFDHFGENPYTIEEVVKDKVWKVAYKMENHMYFGAEGKTGLKVLGIDFTDEQTAWRTMQGAEQYGREASAQALKDLEKARVNDALFDKLGKCKETLEAFGPGIPNMIVVRLNNGDIMLYCPVKVRDECEFGKWLEGLGPVKWVVIGSSSHTLHIPGILKRYPEATYIASKDAWRKLRAFMPSMKPKPMFEYTNPDDLDRLNNLLSEEGVKFKYINGDACTSSLMVFAHKTALEVDLIYSHSDGGLTLFSKEEFDKYKDEDYGLRLFKWSLCSSPTSPNNALPPYRFWFMDPTNPMSLFGVTTPKSDGSSCTDMANSLREAMKEDFDQATGVHINIMDREAFRKSIDLNWGWLDGKSLLEDVKAEKER